MTKYKYKEEDLRNMFLKQYNDMNEKFVCEVPVFCRSIDLVKYDTKLAIVTAIEFKLSNWKKAIEQALQVGICFDYLEICIPKPKTSKVHAIILNNCLEFGIGLFLFDYEKMKFEHILEPKQIKSIWLAQKKTVIDYLEEVKL